MRPRQPTSIVLPGRKSFNSVRTCIVSTHVWNSVQRGLTNYGFFVYHLIMSTVLLKIVIRAGFAVIHLYHIYIYNIYIYNYNHIRIIYHNIDTCKKIPQIHVACVCSPRPMAMACNSMSRKHLKTSAHKALQSAHKVPRQVGCGHNKQRKVVQLCLRTRSCLRAATLSSQSEKEWKAETEALQSASQIYSLHLTQTNMLSIFFGHNQQYVSVMMYSSQRILWW